MNRLLYLLCAALFMLTVMPYFATNNMSVIAAFEGEHYTSGYGTTLASLDFNHDGYDDLIVGAQFYGYSSGQSASRGKVYIYYGGSSFNSNTPASVTLEGNYNGISGRQILSVHNVGDVNGDGFEDLCVYDHAPRYEADKRLMIFYGGTENLNNPDYIITLSVSTTFHEIAKLGDYNGDGFEDIGIDYVPAGILCLSVIYGSSFDEQVVSFAEGSASYAASIKGIGDINNDGYQDIAIGFTDPDPNTGFHLIRIYYGNPGGTFTDTALLIQTQEPITKASKPLGDMNGDGFGDFMGYNSNVGMHAWLGGQDINLAIPSFNFSPEWSGGEFSQSLEFGDFNDDGYGDTVGASFYQRKFSVWMGKQNVNGTSDLIISNTFYDNFGYGLVTGDFNADGYCDIAASAPFPEDMVNTTDFPGYIWVYAGNSQLADTTVAGDDPTTPAVTDVLQMRISPNPLRASTGFVQINLKGQEQLDQGKIELYNLKGQLLYSGIAPAFKQNAVVNIPIQNYASGIYLCRVVYGKVIKTQKISIIK